jgi:alpha-1,2-glucosyltransferase
MAMHLAGRRNTLFWAIGFVGATAVVLVSTPLVEPRYFIVPFVLLRLHSPPAATSPPKRQTPAGARVSHPSWLDLELAYYMLINAATVWLFLNVKFKWEGWEGWQRFMW